jgi:methyl-accepting chemotaxis protein
MVRELQAEVGQIVTAAASLTAASEQTASSVGQISTAMSDVASGAADQRTNVSQSELALERVTSSAATLAGAAARCDTIGSEIRVTTEKARMEIVDALETLTRARAVIDSSRESISRIDGASGHVERFVQTVRLIADQTNLLALNASIEAARAGEHGRGFGVVAEEIRRLASQSEIAAAEVSSIVDAMRGEVKGAVESVNQGSSRLGDFGSVSQGAVAALDRINIEVIGIEEVSRELAGSVSTHKQALSDMVRRLSQASDHADSQAAASEQAAAAAEETAATAEEVASTAHSLAINAQHLGDLALGLKV